MSFSRGVGDDTGGLNTQDATVYMSMIAQRRLRLKKVPVVATMTQNHSESRAVSRSDAVCDHSSTNVNRDIGAITHSVNGDGW